MPFTRVFFILCLRLRRGQHRMQGKPCFASAFCEFAALPPGGLLLPLRGNSPCVAKSDLCLKGLRPLNNPEGFACSMKKWQKPLFLCYNEINNKTKKGGIPMEKTVELLMKNASLLDVELVPSVDKDTQGFRSQTARHNCVVLI